MVHLGSVGGRALLACVGLVLAGASLAHGQNSTRKIRPAPSATAARAGTAVPWRADLDAAIEEARESGRPVFWYIPSLAGSPMDRKPEIDRYMMSGPFSWPTTIALLSEAFVPVRQVASKADQKRFGLAPRGFIEPGYLVLQIRAGQAEPVEAMRLDRITTFERVWFERPLAQLVGREVDPTGVFAWFAESVDPHVEPATAAWKVAEADRAGLPPADQAMLGFLAGVVACNRGDRARGIRLWREVAERFPAEPIAWKAAAEAEGHGPYLRGFEVLRRLPEAATASGTEGSQAPAGVYDEVTLRARALEFLARMRDDAGGLVDSTYDFGGTDSLPNVWTACTAIAGWAVLESIAQDGDATDALAASLLDYASDASHLALSDRDELVWARLFLVRLAARWVEVAPGHPGVAARDAQAVLEAQVAALVEMQAEQGAWYHEYSNPFVTASVLLAFAAARENGVEVDQGVIDRGLRALLACRSEGGAFSYGQTPEGREPRANEVAASGRMPLCELALLRYGRATQDSLTAAIEASFEHHAHLEAIRKYDDHANQFGHGGFFFFYDVRARSEAIAAVSDPARRADFVKRQRALLLALPEIDGCFVDSHELGRTYGTAMGLLSLDLLPAAEPASDSGR